MGSSEASPRRPRPYLIERDPGDTWIIEHDRPRDFYDRGPYGTPGWRPDPRTGRHRRGERPDPIPAPATKEEYEARLREIAFQRFIKKSAGLAAAHVSHRKPSVAARIGAAFKRAVQRITRTPRVARAAL